jgi:histidinol-phosphate aminotransferase
MFDPRSAAAPGILEIPEYVPGRSTEEVTRELGQRDLIKLASNENPYGMSPRAAAAIAASIPRAAAYPEVREPQLHQALGDHCGVEANRIITGNGADAIIYLAAIAYLQPGDEVIIPEMTFDMYALAALSQGARVVAPAMPEFRVEPATILAAVTPRTRMLFLCNPNNPTGTWIDDRGLQLLLGELPGEVFVVCDEVYGDFAPPGALPDLVAAAQDQTRGMLLVRSMAKAYGLAGVRFGYGIAAADTIAVLQRVRAPFDTSLLAQHGALAALSDVEFLRQTVDNNTAGRARLVDELGRRGLSPVPSAANFVLFDSGREAQPLADALLQHGVIVRAPRHPRLHRHLRVSVGLPEQVDRFLAALATVLAE